MSEPVNILIIGAGAIGCTLAWHLSGTNSCVTLLSRGAALQSISKNGLTLIQDGMPMGTRAIRTTDQLPAADTPHAIFICVKQYDLAGILNSLEGRLHADTVIVPLVNGVPWWLLQTNARLKHLPALSWGAAYASYPAMKLAQIIGGVVHIPAQMLDACTIAQGSRNTLALGEIDGSISERLECLTSRINESTLQCTLSSHIDEVLWNKLLGNATFNPISALANACMHEMLHTPDLRQLCTRAIDEVMATGAAIGIAQYSSVEQRLLQAESAGHARTSMLQDAQAGKRIEGEALVGAVTRIARSVAIETPVLDSLWALLQCRFMRNARPKCDLRPDSPPPTTKETS